MDLDSIFKIAIKLFAEAAQEPTAAQFVPVFHSWIQNQQVSDHLLIDVADYDHVHNGPGTVLVAHEANFSTDRADGRMGLLYVRKQPAAGGFGDRLRQALATTLKAAADLESDERLAGRLRFRTDEIEIRLNDRLLAPNTPDNLAALQSRIQAFAANLYGQPVTVESASNPQQVLAVRIKTNSVASVSELAGKLPAPAGV